MTSRLTTRQDPPTQPRPRHPSTLDIVSYFTLIPDPGDSPLAKHREFVELDGRPMGEIYRLDGHLIRVWCATGPTGAPMYRGANREEALVSLW